MRSRVKCTGSAPGSGVRTHGHGCERRWDLELGPAVVPGRGLHRHDRALVARPSVERSELVGDVGLVVGGADPDPCGVTGSASVDVEPIAQHDLVRRVRRVRWTGTTAWRVPHAGGRVRSGVSGSASDTGPRTGTGATPPRPQPGLDDHLDRVAGVVGADEERVPGVESLSGDEVGRDGRSELRSTRYDVTCPLDSCVTPVTVPATESIGGAAYTRNSVANGSWSRWSSCHSQRSTTAVPLVAEQRPLVGGEVGGVGHEHADARRSLVGTVATGDGWRDVLLQPHRAVSRQFALGRPTESIVRTR